MSLGMKMEYTVEVLRGWPHDGALDRSEPIKAGASLANGDWVVKQADNTVDKATTTATNRAGVVIRGNADSGSGAYVGKATVLWGNAILMVKNLPSGVTFTPGAPVTIRKNVSGTAYVDVGVVGTDPIIGHVLDVIAGSSTVDAAITMKF